MCCILYTPKLSSFELFLLLFCYGLSNIGVATGYTIACEMAAPEVAATSMSFANMASVIVAALFQPTIGYILDVFATYDISGQAVYSVKAYHFAMVSLPLCFVVGLAACFYLKETCRKF
jgi:MFS family permease